MNNRKVRLLSFFIFIGCFFIFRGRMIFEQYNISAFSILMTFVISLYGYISLSKHVDKLSSTNRVIVFLGLNKLISFFKKGNQLTFLERNIIFFSVYIPCIFLMYLHSII